MRRHDLRGLPGAAWSIYLALVATCRAPLWRTSAWASRLSDALVANGVTVVTEANVFHLARAEDAARWRWCGSSGSSLLPTVAAVWLGSGGGNGMINGEDRFAERGRAREKDRARLCLWLCANGSDGRQEFGLQKRPSAAIPRCFVQV